jgi:hypothetical protein
MYRQETWVESCEATNIQFLNENSQRYCRV